MNTNRLNGLFILVFVFIALPVYAQTKDGNIMLPTVEGANTASCKVFSVWKPAKKFLKHNPDFLKDGTYKMSGVYIKKGHNTRHGYRRVGQFGLIIPGDTTFTSAMYPAVYVNSDKKINTDGSVYIQVLRDNNSRSEFPLGKGPHAHKHKNSGYFPDYVSALSNPYFRNSYANLNNYYKQKAKEVAARKFINPVYISDIGSSRVETTKLGPNDLFFEFEYIDAQSVTEHYLANDIAFYFPVPFIYMLMIPWNYPLIETRRKGGASYPSNLLLQLHVENYGGEEIKTYSQAVFVKEKHLVAFVATQNYSISARSLILQRALPVAMENLISQFAEDTVAWRQINNQKQKTKKLASQHPAISQYINLQRKLDIVTDSREEIEQSINRVNGELRLLHIPPAGYVSGLSSGMANATVPSNANPVAVVGVMAALVIADIGVYAITQSARKSQNNKQAIFLEEEYNDLALKYRQLIQEEEETRKAISQNDIGGVIELMKH